MNVVSLPTKTFTALIGSYRQVAEDAGLSWQQSLSDKGAIEQSERWNLSDIAGVPGTQIRLSSLGTDAKTLAEINRHRSERGEIAVDTSALPRGWQDLVRALVVKHLIAEKKSPGHAADNIARPARCLATCCLPKEPWEITAEDVRSAIGIIRAVSQKTAENAEAIARWMSAERLPYAHPLVGQRKQGRSTFRPSRASDVRQSLDERKRLNRLPEEKAFWELVRIALDAHPASFYDDMRLRACLIQVLMGLRVGETVTLPANTLYVRDLVGADAARPSAVGGRDRILSLRHFSEKQAGADARGIVWAEKSTSVITLFESVIEQTVGQVLARTAPLRERLKAQHQTGRIFPELDPEQPLGIADIYPRVTGNPVVCSDDTETERLLAEYRTSWNVDSLHEIERRQSSLDARAASLHPTVAVFASRSRKDGMPWRDARTGERVGIGRRFTRHEMIVRVAELEDFLRSNKSSKLHDLTPFLLSGGRTLATHELLFLHPKRALTEGRNGGVCDITRYPFVGHLQPNDIHSALQNGDNGLFAKYGKDEASRTLELSSHAIRHLHNNELFAAGVSDTVITHRFGRKRVVQSHAYDNRTLAEHLTDMDVPAGAVDTLEGSALDAFRLIESGQARGEVVIRFKALQSSEGDEAALAFLNESIDQIQLTPYDVCTASFVSEPCPKHLTCLSGCSHLLRTSDAKTVANNRTLLSRFDALLANCPPPAIETPPQTAWRLKLEGDVARLRQLLSTEPGQFAFPAGDDHGSPYNPEPMSLL